MPSYGLSVVSMGKHEGTPSCALDLYWPALYDLPRESRNEPLQAVAGRDGKGGTGTQGESVSLPHHGQMRVGRSVALLPDCNHRPSP